VPAPWENTQTWLSWVFAAVPNLSGGGCELPFEEDIAELHFGSCSRGRSTKPNVEGSNNSPSGYFKTPPCSMNVSSN